MCAPIYSALICAFYCYCCCHSCVDISCLLLSPPVQTMQTQLRFIYTYTLLGDVDASLYTLTLRPSWSFVYKQTHMEHYRFVSTLNTCLSLLFMCITWLTLSFFISWTAAHQTRFTIKSSHRFINFCMLLGFRVCSICVVCMLHAFPFCDYIYIPTYTHASTNESHKISSRTTIYIKIHAHRFDMYA